MFGLADRFDKPAPYSPGPGHYDQKSDFATAKTNDLTTQLVQKLYQLPNDPLNLTSVSVRSTRSHHFDDSLAARVARLETSLNCNRTPLCAPGRRRGGGPPGVLANVVENPKDAGFQRHSWLAGEINGDTFCFKAVSTPAAIGPGSYCSPESNAPEKARGNKSHNYLAQRSEEISRNRRDLWIQRRMKGMQPLMLGPATPLNQSAFPANQTAFPPGQLPGQHYSQDPSFASQPQKGDAGFSDLVRYVNQSEGVQQQPQGVHLFYGGGDVDDRDLLNQFGRGGYLQDPHSSQPPSGQHTPPGSYPPQQKSQQYPGDSSEQQSQQMQQYHPHQSLIQQHPQSMVHPNIQAQQLQAMQSLQIGGASSSTSQTSDTRTNPFNPAARSEGLLRSVLQNDRGTALNARAATPNDWNSALNHSALNNRSTAIAAAQNDPRYGGIQNEIRYGAPPAGRSSNSGMQSSMINVGGMLSSSMNGSFADNNPFHGIDPVSRNNSFDPSSRSFDPTSNSFESNNPFEGHPKDPLVEELVRDYHRTYVDKPSTSALEELQKWRSQNKVNDGFLQQMRNEKAASTSSSYLRGQVMPS